MSLIDFSCLCMFIVFAQLTESRVLILRDDDDEPLVLGHVDRSTDEDVRHKHQASSDYKPKRFHAKKTVLQYGRHIYHLDNFKDLKELRTKMNQREPDSISYDYVDMDDLFRDRDSAKNGVGDLIKDLVRFSNTPLQFCNGDRYDEDLRKFSKHKNDHDADWSRKTTQFGRMKRFQVVDNRHKSKTHDASSEEHHEKKQKSTKMIKRKKKKHSSESAESVSKESDSEEKSWGSHKKTKKKFKPPKVKKTSSEENIVQIKRKPKKKHLDDDSTDASDEKWMQHDIDSKSNEHFHNKKKKKKKINYEASDDTTRKTFAVEDDFFVQGNKIFHVKEKRKKKHNDFDRRRRLEHFLPKRYHWDPSDIHDLGYYWFNGPKGRYAAPKLLN